MPQSQKNVENLIKVNCGSASSMIMCFDAALSHFNKDYKSNTLQVMSASKVLSILKGNAFMQSSQNC